MACLGRLRRHYTLNIDGLAESVGLATWHPTDNPSGAHPPHGMIMINEGWAGDLVPHVNTTRSHPPQGVIMIKEGGAGDLAPRRQPHRSASSTWCDLCQGGRAGGMYTRAIACDASAAVA